MSPELRETCVKRLHDMLSGSAQLLFDAVVESLRKDAPAGSSDVDAALRAHLHDARRQREEAEAERDRLQDECDALVRERDQGLRLLDQAIAERDELRVRLASFERGADARAGVAPPRPSPVVPEEPAAPVNLDQIRTLLRAVPALPEGVSADLAVRYVRWRIQAPGGNPLKDLGINGPTAGRLNQAYRAVADLGATLVRPEARAAYLDHAESLIRGLSAEAVGA